MSGMIATVNGKLYGKPGAGIYNLSLDQLQDCCCGLKVESVEFELLPGSNPCCNRVERGSPERGCRPYDLTLAGATLLAFDHLEELDVRSSGDRLGVTPQCPRGCGFCENATFAYFLTGAVETDAGFVVTFEAEDCIQPPNAPNGISPRDYLCTVTIKKCR